MYKANLKMSFVTNLIPNRLKQHVLRKPEYYCGKGRVAREAPKGTGREMRSHPHTGREEEIEIL